MSLLKADQLLYSWHHSRTLQTYSKLSLDSLQSTTTYNINKRSARLARQKLEKFLGCFCCKRYLKEFFLSTLKSKKPYLKRWPHHLPLISKKSMMISLIRLLVPCPIELFVAIDDDHGIPGYSLISRNFYPNRVTRDEMKIEFPINTSPLLLLYRGLPKSVLYPINSFITLLKRIYYTINSFTC